MCGFNFCSLFDVINQMKYAIYKLGITSISVIHEDEGGKKRDEAAA